MNVLTRHNQALAKEPKDEATVIACKAEILKITRTQIKLEGGSHMFLYLGVKHAEDPLKEALILVPLELKSDPLQLPTCFTLRLKEAERRVMRS